MAIKNPRNTTNDPAEGSISGKKIKSMFIGNSATPDKRLFAPLAEVITRREGNV